MRKIKKARYYADIKSNLKPLIICCFAGDPKMETFLFDPLNKDLDNLKIKGIVILTLREPELKIPVINDKVFSGFLGILQKRIYKKINYTKH